MSAFRLTFSGYATIPRDFKHRDYRRLLEAIEGRHADHQRAADPWQALAVAVIGQALRDIRGARTREEALAFFSDGRLDYWAPMTELSSAAWREIADSVLRFGIPRSARWRQPRDHNTAAKKRRQGGKR